MGLVIGLVLPFLGIFIMYLVKFSGTPFNDFMKAFFSDGNIAAKVLSLSVLINVVPFIYYTNRRLDHTARGLLVATMLYFVLVILLKFVW